jgi:hypothetical protein
MYSARWSWSARGLGPVGGFHHDRAGARAQCGADTFRFDQMLGGAGDQRILEPDAADLDLCRGRHAASFTRGTQ